ncbi:hypothetical protein C6370_20500 [Bacillus atrophaeus]|uniref:hypothetical protein n=1 Tax=Bacillus atrophaeus TaxID=1452 RepID=UPI000D05F43D|nr:hypothetical protein [Bacillus atrophaeus]PSA89342.1 hypothetical protein C6370_20500 [Bacillus atrophaeus]
MIKDTNDYWESLNKKEKLIVTDLLKKRPYTSKGNRSCTRLYDFDGNYYCSISSIRISMEFLEDIFRAMVSDDRFKTFGLNYYTDTELYEFEINKFEGGYLSSSDKRLINAVINTTYQALINMKDVAK